MLTALMRCVGTLAAALEVQSEPYCCTLMDRLKPAGLLTAHFGALQSHVSLLDKVLTLPANAVAVPLPAAGSGPNGGVAIETFNATAYPVLLTGAILPVLLASAAPSMMSTPTTG